MENILYEPLQTHSYYHEYLTLLKRYENVARTSIFARYFNINTSSSIYDTDIISTDDKFKSGIYFDSYDYTPIFETTPFISMPVDRSDLTGVKYDSNFEIVTYTINEPHIGDIIIFPYAPFKSEEIFRVINLTTHLAVKTQNINSFKLTLEYAPLKTISDLKINTKYAYLISKEKNILLEEYIKFIEMISICSELMGSFDFNSKYEMYFYLIGEYSICPITINKYLYSYMCNEKLNDRYFDKFKKPYGCVPYEIGDYGINILNGDRIKLSKNGLPMVDLNNKLIDYLSTEPGDELLFNIEDNKLLKFYKQFKDYAIR